MNIQDIVKMGYDDFNQRTFETKAKNYTAENFVGLDTPTGQEVKGVEGRIQSLRGWLAIFPDAKVEVVNQQVAGNKVTTTFRGRGTFTGKLQTPQGVIPGNGRKSDVEFQDVVEVKNDKIVSSHLNYDIQDMMHQLGLEAPTA